MAEQTNILIIQHTYHREIEAETSAGRMQRAFTTERLAGRDETSRARTPQVEDGRPSKRRRVIKKIDVRGFLDTEARVGDGSEDEDEDEEGDAAFIDNDNSVKDARASSRRLFAVEDCGVDADEPAARALTYKVRAREEMAATARAPTAPPPSVGLSWVERVEEQLGEMQRGCPGEFPASSAFQARYQWGRLKEGKGVARVGQLALVYSANSVLVLVPRSGPKKAVWEGEWDTPVNRRRWVLARLGTSHGIALDGALSLGPPPTQEELVLWDAVEGGLLQSAVSPTAGMAVGLSSRAVVNWPRSEHHEKSGFVVGEDGTNVRLRLSVAGEMIRSWDPQLWEVLTAPLSPGVVEIAVPRWTLKRHLLSLPGKLCVLDRVRVLAGISTGLGGRVKRIDWSEREPLVSMWGAEGMEVTVTLGEVRREFMLGDLVQIVVGPSTGKRGIVVGRTDAGGLDVFTAISPETTLAGDPKLTISELEDIVRTAMVHALEDQVEFDQGEHRLGGWTLPASTEPAYRAQAMCEEDRRRQDEAMRGGRRFRGTPVAIVHPHRMKGRRGIVVDDHFTAGADGGVRAVVFTVRIEVTNVQVQVPEAQARHLWTGLPLHNAEHVIPWARPLLLGFSDVDEEWEGDGHKTPEAKDPTDANWKATEAEAQAAVERAAMARAAIRIGEDQGRWLCIPGLRGKRVEVRVMQKLAGKRVSGAQAAAVGKAGYIELKEALTEDKLNKPISVRIKQMTRPLQIEPRWLAPIRTMMTPLSTMPASIANARGGVVVIGPDSLGAKDHLGDYGQTCPNSEEDCEDMVWVEFEGAGGVAGARRHYPLDSLCRSGNGEGTVTKRT
ncbi:hypothetical protein C8R46DRAFT_1093399 [Mycena filopes]|nr:hypothetical protein C8R46DRAFT_1093399 [Mycena filopes]